jgi:hypothetical protein
MGRGAYAALAVLVIPIWVSGCAGSSAPTVTAPTATVTVTATPSAPSPSLGSTHTSTPSASGPAPTATVTVAASSAAAEENTLYGNPPRCASDPSSRAACAFVDAIRGGQLSTLTTTAQQAAQALVLPDGAWGLQRCELVTQLTAQCAVLFLFRPGVRLYLTLRPTSDNTAFEVIHAQLEFR